VSQLGNQAAELLHLGLELRLDGVNVLKGRAAGLRLERVLQVQDLLAQREVLGEDA
jgi:hypothetical protein